MGSPSEWKLLTQQEKIRILESWNCAKATCVAAVCSDLEPWPGRTSPSASSLSSVFCASCRRSAAGPWADCWTTPGTWSRNGWSHCRHRRRRRRHCPLCRWNPLLVSSWAERLLVFERLLETNNNKKMFKILIFCGETGNKRCQKQIGYTHMAFVDQRTSVSGSWRELCPGSVTRPPQERRTSCYTLDRP